jgi:hypothetical protein
MSWPAQAGHDDLGRPRVNLFGGWYNITIEAYLIAATHEYSAVPATTFASVIMRAAPELSNLA